MEKQPNQFVFKQKRSTPDRLKILNSLGLQIWREKMSPGGPKAFIKIDFYAPVKTLKLPVICQCGKAKTNNNTTAVLLLLLYLC